MTVAVLCFVALVVSLYVVIVIWDAKHDVAAAPREPMYVCDKHGAFLAKYLLKLEGATEKPIDMCPFCYDDQHVAAQAMTKILKGK